MNVVYESLKLPAHRLGVVLVEAGNSLMAGNPLPSRISSRSSCWNVSFSIQCSKCKLNSMQTMDGEASMVTHTLYFERSLANSQIRSYL